MYSLSSLSILIDKWWLHAGCELSAGVDAGAGSEGADSRLSHRFVVGLVLCAAYEFFALEFGKVCHCGDAYGKHGKAADPAKDCSMPCGENPAVVCGGFYYENVYSH